MIKPFGSPEVETPFQVRPVARIRAIERPRAQRALGWCRKIQARLKVGLTIEDVLDEGLPRA